MRIGYITVCLILSLSAPICVNSSEDNRGGIGSGDGSSSMGSYGRGGGGSDDYDMGIEGIPGSDFNPENPGSITSGGSPDNSVYKDTGNSSRELTPPQNAEEAVPGASLYPGTESGSSSETGIR